MSRTYKDQILRAKKHRKAERTKWVETLNKPQTKLLEQYFQNTIPQYPTPFFNNNTRVIETLS